MALAKDANNVSVPSYGPATDSVAITKSDVTDLSGLKIKGIWVGVAGDVAIIGLRGTVSVVFTAPAGSIIPIMPSKVMSTGTTASGLVGLI